MALINRLFPRKIRTSQSGTSKSDSCLIAKRNSKNQDISIESKNNQLNAQTNHSSALRNSSNDGPGKLRLLLFCESDARGRQLLFDSGQIRNDIQQQDLQLIKDMVFGSATLKYLGDNYRIHDFADDHWKGYQVMLSKVFHVPLQSATIKGVKSSQAIVTCNSGRIDKVDSNTTDSGVCESTGSGWSSVSSLAAAGRSQASFSSISLAIPRIGSSRKAFSDSLLSNRRQPVPTEGSVNPRGRKVRLAVALLFQPPQELTEIPMRDVIFGHFSLVEHFVQRLQLGVLRAYFSRNSFNVLIRDAIRQFHRDVANIYSPYLEHPAYLDFAGRPLTVKTSDIAHHFMAQMESIVTQTDTKLTHFFWSSLLSAVLTYHVQWLHSFVSEPAEAFDCGTRILVLSKDKSLAQRLLYVLSYFVRQTAVPRPANADTVPPSPTTSAPPPPPAPPAQADSCMKIAATNCIRRDMDRLSVAVDNPSALLIKSAAGSGSGSNRAAASHRNSHQLEHTRYLRSYYDVRFQMSPAGNGIVNNNGHNNNSGNGDDSVAKKSFASVKYSIAKTGFQDFGFQEKCPESGGDPSSSQPPPPCAFFIGSIPDQPAASPQSLPSDPDAANGGSKFLEMPVVRLPQLTQRATKASYLSQWAYGSDLNAEYQAGRVMQSCDPSSCDWLHDLQLDLRAAVPSVKTASCVVANTETWEVQVLTCMEEEISPSRIKQMWVPVTMSGQVAALVESTQLLWLMQHNAEQCLDHIDNRLHFLCQKSEDLGSLLSASIRSWNVDHITSFLGIETQDIPLLMAACSVHSPSVAHMGGVTIL